MFVEKEGPTALRADLIRALSFSVEALNVETRTGVALCCAALSAVWNGKRGYVALIVRHIETPELHRFVSSEGIHSPADLALTIDEGLAFAENMGFTMDPPEFPELDAARQGERLEVWNEVRKPGRGSRHMKALPRGRPGSHEAEEPESKAVLGRIDVVRRGDASRAPDLLARLRAYF